MKKNLRTRSLSLAVLTAVAIALFGWIAQTPPASAQSAASEIQGRNCRVYIRSDKKVVATCDVVTTATKTAHYVWAGPTSGSPAAPTWRALVATDLPGTLGNTTIPTLTVGTALVMPTKTANYVMAGPTTGSAAAPDFRALVAADIPATLGNTTFTSSVTIGTATITNGSGVPSDPCVGGSLYTRTGATGGLYVCKNTTWAAATVP